MTPIIEDAVLGSHLDCQDFTILNIGRLLPVPSALVDIDDARLSDQRLILDGTVTDESVSSHAGISQSKLFLNGVIPPAWLGSGADQAAPGNLVERISNKGSANGYVPLGSGGLIPSIHIIAGPESGTVNTVKLLLPDEFKKLAEITSSGTFNVLWENVPDVSWFGVYGTIGFSTDLIPSFITKTLPLEFMPDLVATKFTTGTFAVLRLPEAIGMGVNHSIGILPDPGANGAPGDYIGRDMKWHSFTTDLAYQPRVPNIQITVNFETPGMSTGAFNVTIRCLLAQSVLFYRINGGAFTEVHVAPGTSGNSITLNLSTDDFIEAYGSKPGYNNSDIATYVVQSTTS